MMHPFAASFVGEGLLACGFSLQQQNRPGGGGESVGAETWQFWHVSPAKLARSPWNEVHQSQQSPTAIAKSARLFADQARAALAKGNQGFAVVDFGREEVWMGQGPNGWGQKREIRVATRWLKYADYGPAWRETATFRTATDTRLDDGSVWDALPDFDSTGRWFIRWDEDLEHCGGSSAAVAGQ